MERVQTLAEFLGTDQADNLPTELPQLTVKDFCKGVLESREYRQSVLHRVTLGTLPPAVECRMYDYAYGKPVERLEVKDTTENLAALPVSHLRERLRERITLLESLVDLVDQPEGSIH